MTQLQGQSQLIGSSQQLACFAPGCVQYVDGKPVRMPDVERFVRANVQPLSGRELLLVPEGDRHKEQYWAFVQLPDVLKVQDRIIFRNVSFQVQASEFWDSYTKARMVRIDVGPNASGS